MTLTQADGDKIKHLLKLADICQEFEFVELKLTDAWCDLREEHGLAKLLLLIQEYAKEKSRTETSTSQT